MLNKHVKQFKCIKYQVENAFSLIKLNCLFITKNISNVGDHLGFLAAILNFRNDNHIFSERAR